MNKQLPVKAKTFHGHLDTELAFHTGRIIETRETKYFVIQERELAYRFYLHQHPYVQPLTQRLLRSGTGGLQAADTEYAAGEISLPYGVDVELGGDVQATVPNGARIGLLDNVTATDAGGAQVDIAKGTELKLSAVAGAGVAGGTAVTLVEYVKPTPYPRVTFTLTGASQAAVSIDTAIQLANATQVALPDGTSASIPAGTTVVLAAGTEVGIPGGAIDVEVLRRRMRPVSDLYADFFETSYDPAPELVRRPYPVKDLDFTSPGAYSVYNWELFYHVPFTIAIHLSKNQRFAEAQRWFHYLFDPTDDSEGPTPERFWKVRPFQYTDVHKIEELLVNLATGADAELRNETISSIEAWKDAPFRPHVIARYRQQAYMYKTVMAYLDNLVAWGDSLFRQDTGEAIDEALMLYVLAANILGPKPLPVPKKGTVRRQTYVNLRNDLAQFGTVMRDMEPEMPFDLMPFPAPASGDNARLATLRSLGKALYFCVPQNDKLVGYWDTVADRLFKIRNSLNIQGTFRQLALFEPPIDPAMLARATAAGLDVGAIVNGRNQPLPLVRFAFLVQEAAEIAQEVKSLGNSLLLAMEKEDGEAMALLRAKHERAVMEMVEHVKYGQLQEAVKSKEGLLQALALTVQRYTFYERQLGRKTEDIEKAMPQLTELDRDNLQKMKFAMHEPTVSLRQSDVDIAQDLGASGGRILSSHERQEIEKLHMARDLNNQAADKDKIAAGLSLLPELGVDFHFWGMGGHVAFGGSALSRAMSFWASFAKTDADQRTYESGNSARVGSYSRRELDWAHQSNLAAGEIEQIFKQIRAAQIREAVAEQELKSHRLQMKHAEEIERFLNEEGTEKNGKKTNKALYAWMKREVKGLYSQSFQFAFDIARKAERALQHELGNPELSYLQFGYLAGKEGLLAGEKLYLDVKRMEMAYHEQNQRELELTKHVSALQVDPLALVQLRATGRCTLRLPESLFDMDGPGHYFRRIKTVAVSIPCVSGSYASVNCTLTLLKSSIRKTATVGDQYSRIDANDERFSDHFGSLQSIVTSSAQNDSGLFETNLRDERYLPFENSGAISEWQLQFPADPSKKDPAQFDYSTISDVILHVRYTARDGGGLLRNGAVAQLRELIAAGEVAGSMRLFSVRHEFPAEWATLTTQVPPANHRYELKLNLRPEHYPFWSQGRVKAVTGVDILARSTATPTPGSVNVAAKADKNDAAAKPDPLTKDVNRGSLLVGKFKEIPLPQPEGDLTLFIDDNSLSDLWIGLTWGEA